MRIEKLNENKIRIFLNTKDLQENNIDLHDFMSNSEETQDLFLEMLNKAETEVGFKTNNYKLIIEALASSDGNFILTVTRVKPETNDILKMPSLRPKIKKHLIKPNKMLSIYLFNTFDEFCDFCTYMKTRSTQEYLNKFKNTSLVFYKNNYYLILNNLKLDIPELKKFSCIISEFSNKIKSDALFERKLKEYGKTIISKNAISTCLKYFN